MAMTRWRGRAALVSSICITQNCQAPPHRNCNNLGLSSITASRLLLRPLYNVGELEVWNYFKSTAQRWHMVLPFTGDRISVVLYKRIVAKICIDRHGRNVNVLPDWGSCCPQKRTILHNEYSPASSSWAPLHVIAAEGGHSEDFGLEDLIDGEIDHMLKDPIAESNLHTTSGSLRSVTPVLAVSAARTVSGASATMRRASSSNSCPSCPAVEPSTTWPVLRSR
eukprot:4908823-Amphidinium_carterae.1